MALTARRITARIPHQSQKWVPKCPFLRQLLLGRSEGGRYRARSVNNNFSHERRGLMQKQDYIGVFDSGVGGLSVLRHLQRVLPGERFVYFGDCANAPYGNRATEDVRALTLAAAEHLVNAWPLKALVVACNTATAAAIGALRKKYPDLIVIGIEPALKLAADSFPGGRIGVMATQVTLREEKFDVLLHRFDAGCTVTKIPAPGLVELIEAGQADCAETDKLLHQMLLLPLLFCQQRFL